MIYEIIETVVVNGKKLESGFGVFSIKEKAEEALKEISKYSTGKLKNTRSTMKRKVRSSKRAYKLKENLDCLRVVRFFLSPHDNLMNV